LRYLAQITVHENTDSADKRNHDVINGSVLRQLCAIGAISSEIV